MVKFLKKRKIVGLDISDYSIEVIQIQKGGQILAHGRALLENGIVHGGKVLDKDRLAKSLREILRSTKPNKLSPSTEPLEVILGMPEAHTFSHYFEFPGGGIDKDLRKKVLAESAKVIPFHPNEVYWDFIVLRKDTKTLSNLSEKKKDGKAKKKSIGKIGVMYIAVPKEILEGYIRAIHASRIRLIAADVEMLSLGRSLISYGPKRDDKKEGGIMICDIGSWSTAVGFFDGRGNLQFSSSIPIGGNTISEAVAKKVNIPYSEADTMKKQFGIKKRSENKAFEAIDLTLKQLGNEINRAKSYYIGKTKKSVNQAIIAGGSANLAGLDVYLKSVLGINVEIGNPLRWVKNPKTLPGELPPLLFSNAIGLALRAMDHDPETSSINLLPKGGYKDIVRTPAARKVTDIKSASQSMPQRVAPMREYEAQRNNRHLNFSEFFGTFIFAMGFLFVAFGFLAVVIYRYILSEGGITIVTQQQEFQQYSSPEDKRELIESNQELQIIVEDEVGGDEGNADLSTADELPQKEAGNIITTDPVDMVIIRNTPTGWLNVRSGAGTNYSSVGRVNPGEEYELLEEDNGWFKIKLPKGEGWIFGQYATKK